MEVLLSSEEMILLGRIAVLPFEKKRNNYINKKKEIEKRKCLDFLEIMGLFRLQLTLPRDEKLMQLL